jgi:AraC-like DNA-binding protein
VRHYGQTNLQYSLTEADVLIDVALAGNIQHRHDANSELISPKVATFHAPGIVHYRCTPTGYHSLFLKIPRDAIETHLARLLQRPIRHPLAFEASLNLAVEGQRLWQLLNWMCCETGQNEPQQPQSIACRIEKLLFDMLLYTYPNNYSAALKAIKSTIIPRQLRAVIQAIRESPEQNWTLTNMAQRADISVRTLCELFRNFRACTPMEFLRSVRLTRTHEEFKQLGPRTSVAEVAKRWGFCHPGRFAAAYTKTFGEAPSDTLRGSRRNGAP